MSIVISQLMLDKLVHDIQEIRIRMLYDIEGKLRRGLWNNDEMRFNAVSLFKNLIRWFGKTPICEEVKVLEIMSLLLESKYAHDIVRFFAPDRIIKELDKVRCLIGNNKKLNDLVSRVSNQVNAIKIQHVVLEEDMELESTMKIVNLAPGDICPVRRRRTIMDSVELRREDDPTFFTECWEKPSQTIANMLETFNDSLLTDEDETNLNLALSYAIPYIKDYPAEFFLQPPYIYLSIIRLIHKRKVKIECGFEILWNLLQAVQKRVRQRKLVTMYMPAENIDALEYSQLSPCAFALDLFHLGFEQLKELPTDSGLPSSNLIFLVLSDVVSFAKDGLSYLLDCLPSHRFVEIRNDMGYLMKHFRQECESNSKNSVARTRYRQVLQTLLDCLNACKEQTKNGSDVVWKQEQGKYSPSDFATMNSTAHRRVLEGMDETWLRETQIALLDYPLKEAWPDVYNNLWEHTYKEDDRIMNMLDGLKELLEPAVKMLRGGKSALILTGEQLLDVGPLVMNTLFLHRSFDIMHGIMKAVGKCALVATEDGTLWDVTESITLRLLADRDEEIRCVAYTLCTNMMKEFIGQLDEGAILTRRSVFSTTSPKLRTLGIPLTLQILTEITCFGYTSNKYWIHQCAERMLLFICNAKTILREKWSDVQEIILPIAPLLQTAAVGIADTQLRTAVIGLFHPDFGLPWLEMLQGNLRLLFHENATIREDALTRVLFLISSIEQSEHLSPRIENIGDTIPNSLCMLQTPYDRRRQQMVDVYEVSAVRPLLDTLEQQDSDPALRRSTLTQLNVMAEDPVLCELIHNSSGWVLVLQALNNALREDHCQDYLDSAMPAVGILTKLCFSVVTFRRFLGANPNAYHLIVRALLSFHHMPVFRVECCALLYLLLFADCSTGSGPMVSLPALCSTSAFRVPFVCLYHWQQSPFRQLNELEALFLDLTIDEGALGFDWSGTHSLRIDMRTTMQQVGKRAHKAETTLAGATVTYREHWLRYVRFTFSDLWFGGIQEIFKAYEPKRQKSSEHDLAAIEYGGNVAGVPPLRFTSNLRLTKKDLRLLKMVDCAAVFRKAARRISTAKAHEEVYSALASLRANMTETVTFPDEERLIISTLKHFFHSPPSTTADQQLLVQVLITVGDLIDYNRNAICKWVIGMLSSEENFFFQLLRDKASTVELYDKTISLLWKTMRFKLLEEEPIGKMHPAPETTIQRPKSTANDKPWDTRLFITLFNQLSIEMDNFEPSRVYMLVKLLSILAGRVFGKLADNADIIPKLMLYIARVHSSSYTASTVVRSLLVIFRELLCSTSLVSSITLKPADYRLLSTQCGNSCPLIRACAWSILSVLANSVSNAKHILQQCAYLPGGIYASCVSTILDPRETCLVRETAIGLLAELCSHYSELHSNKESLETILAMLSKQQVYTQTFESLEHHTSKEFFTGEERPTSTNSKTIVSSGLVKGYACMYLAFLEMDPDVCGPMLLQHKCVAKMIDCIAALPSGEISDPCWLMVAEVCSLLSWFTQNTYDCFISNVLSQTNNFIERIISLLQPPSKAKRSYQRIAMTRAVGSIFNLLSRLADYLGAKYPVVHITVAKADARQIAQVIEEGICSEKLHFQFTALNFLDTLLVHMSYTEEQSFPSLLQTLDTIDKHAEKHKPNNSSASWKGDSEDDEDMENANPNQPLNTNVTVGNPKDIGLEIEPARADQSGSGHLFSVVLQQLKVSRSLPALTRDLIYFAVQAMLHMSPKCRQLAWETDLLSFVIEQFNHIYERDIGRLNYSDFARKHGDAKKTSVTKHLMEMIRILACWFQTTTDALRLKQDQVNAICRIVLLFWPWICASSILAEKFLETLAVIAARSIIFCKTLASTFSGFPHSILKLVVVMVTTETARVKGPKSVSMVLDTSLQLLISCCQCQETRSMIAKLNVFDNINKLHPSITKMQKPWVDVTRKWLVVYEVYTQYSDVQEVRHITVLASLMRKVDHYIRISALSIIRNLTFVPANRPALLASSDYMYLLQGALQPTANTCEQLIAAVTLWKIIANNPKGRAVIKCSPLVRCVAELVKHHSLTERARRNNELWNTLMTVYHILQS